jgi:hypothetical protein
MADVQPSVDVRTWAPSVDPRANLVLEPPSSPGPWSVAAGAWMHGEYDSVVLRDPGTGAVFARPLASQIGVDVVVSLGLGTHAEVGLRVPTFLDEQGSSDLSPAVVSSGKVPTSGFGDVAMLGKATLLANDRGGFGLATLGEVALPTGAKTSFFAERAATVSLRVLADVSLRIASLQASVGYKLRTEEVSWPATAAGSVSFGDEIPWTAGVMLRPAVIHAIDPGGRQAWEVALHGWLPAGPTAPFGAGGSGSAAVSPVLLALSDRVGFGSYRDGFVLAGVDVGLDRAVGVPAVRATVSVGWRFGRHDQDGDGVRDDVDQCPTLAEDRDGFEDADGCPEADNDDDGIVDSEDACPNVPGVASRDPSKNGCPQESTPPTVMPTRPSSPEFPGGSRP